MTESTVMPTRPRPTAWGGVVGPTAFIGAWMTGGIITERDYSPIDNAISRLAEIGADTRPLMTSGFIVFGLALPAFAIALRDHLPGRAWITAAATGVATLAVAATPLEKSSLIDRLHGVSASVGYVTLAATPLLAARPLLRSGHRLLGGAGLVAASVSTLALALTVSSWPTGLFQRIGLTASDLWIVATAVTILRGRLDPRDCDTRGQTSQVA
jgi:hypothetical membrane protein